jgi:heme o synthase
VALSILSIALGFVAHLGWVFIGITIVLDSVFLAYEVPLWSDPSPRRAMRLFGYSITYLTVLFVAMGAIAVVRHP